MRKYSFLDQIVSVVDRSVVTVFGSPVNGRETPGGALEEGALAAEQKRHSAGLVRVDHSGEVCAQALYLGQALTAHDQATREAMQQASEEENDHLVWCQQRLEELGSHTSYLNPIWFVGSLAMGMIAGVLGDRWSLGFVAETERQVTAHLDGQLKVLPPRDAKTAAILKQMREDEAAHATMACQAGAHELPGMVKRLMRGLSKIMTTIAYRI